MAVWSTMVEGLEGEVGVHDGRIPATMFSNSGPCPYRVQMKDHHTGMM